MTVQPEQRFATVVEALAGYPNVTPPSDEAQASRRFGSNGLKVHDRIFAMLVRGTLVVKLPRQRVDALVAAGDGVRFDAGRGRPMKEWLALDPESEMDWLALAREAMAFVERG